MKPGREIRVAVGDLDTTGAGMATSGGIAVHVPGALPGEDIAAEIEHVSGHGTTAWARLGAISRRSPDRATPVCRAHGRCGGCVLQHLAYPAQVAWKERALRARIAADADLAGVPIGPIVPSPAAIGYRNGAKLVVARDAAGGIVLGAYAPRSHDVVDLAGCAVVEPSLEKVAAALRDLLAAREIQPYDERRLTGTLRTVALRANRAGRVLVTLVTAGDGFAAGRDLVAALLGRCPEIVGVVQNVNPTRGNAIFGTAERTLGGSSILEDEIAGVRLRLSSRSFFQVNRHVAAAAYAEIARAAAPTKGQTVVDAYAGVGGIALRLAGDAGSVVGIEENPVAVADAVASAKENGITNVRFVAGDVATEMAAVPTADVVVLNPPRKGCAPAVLDRVAALGPRIVAYLSCAPETLLRDLSILARLGYRTERITPFDMLPHTPHIEALAILRRA